MAIKMKYFVVKPDGCDQSATASREAILAYANAIAPFDAELATSLLAWAARAEYEAAKSRSRQLGE